MVIRIVGLPPVNVLTPSSFLGQQPVILPDPERGARGGFWIAPSLPAGVATWDASEPRSCDTTEDQRQTPFTPPIRLSLFRFNFFPPASEYEAGFQPTEDEESLEYFPECGPGGLERSIVDREMSFSV